MVKTLKQLKQENKIRKEVIKNQEKLTKAQKEQIKNLKELIKINKKLEEEQDKKLTKKLR